jgi:hypothetical protein
LLVGIHVAMRTRECFHAHSQSPRRFSSYIDYTMSGVAPASSDEFKSDFEDLFFIQSCGSLGITGKVQKVTLFLTRYKHLITSLGGVNPDIVDPATHPEHLYIQQVFTSAYAAYFQYCRNMQYKMDFKWKPVESGASDKAKAKNDVPWSVSITGYLDDYKSRGSDWSTTDEYHFSNRQKASDFLCKTLVNVLHEESESKEDVVKIYPDIWRKDGLIKREFRQSLPDLERAMPSMRGEFVPCTFDYSIKPIKFDQYAVEHQQDVLSDSDDSADDASANASDSEYTDQSDQDKDDDDQGRLSDQDKAWAESAAKAIMKRKREDAMIAANPNDYIPYTSDKEDADQDLDDEREREHQDDEQTSKRQCIRTNP